MKIRTIIIILVVILFIGARLVVTMNVSGGDIKTFCDENYNTDVKGYKMSGGNFCKDANGDYHYFTMDDVKEYCGKIGFFELTKWDNDC